MKSGVTQPSNTNPERVEHNPNYFYPHECTPTPDSAKHYIDLATFQKVAKSTNVHIHILMCTTTTQTPQPHRIFTPMHMPSQHITQFREKFSEALRPKQQTHTFFCETQFTHQPKPYYTATSSTKQQPTHIFSRETQFTHHPKPVYTATTSAKQQQTHTFFCETSLLLQKTNLPIHHL